MLRDKRGQKRKEERTRKQKKMKGEGHKQRIKRDKKEDRKIRER